MTRGHHLARVDKMVKTKQYLEILIWIAILTVFLTILPSA